MPDPRGRQGKQWGLSPLLNSVLCGMMAGCQSLSQVERLTGWLAQGSQKVLGVKRRIADTTLRDLVCKLSPEALRDCLRRLVHVAHKRGVLKPVGLPFGVVSMDGKWTALPTWIDEPFVQPRTCAKTGKHFGILRTVTSMLVSAGPRPVLDAHPIPKGTNEMGVFVEAVTALKEHYDGLFRLVLYDAGVTCEKNAAAVLRLGKDYLFHVKNESHYLYQAIRHSFEHAYDPVTAESRERVNGVTILRRATVLPVSGVFGLNKNVHMWSHAKTLVRVEAFEIHDGGTVVTQIHNRFYITSLKPGALRAPQWLEVVRRHWAVENNGHHTLDAVLKEDDKPWVQSDGNGALVLMMMRRLAYNLLSLFRCLTTQGDSKPQWRALMHWVRAALHAADYNIVQELRQRQIRQPQGKRVFD